MTNRQNEKKALEKVKAAIVLADEAETLHGQPLYYEKDGNYVDVVGLLRETAEGLRRIIIEEAE